MTDTTISGLSAGDPLPRIVLIAVVIFVIITVLWALPGWLRRGRSSYRPGDPWVGEPLWVGAPASATAGQFAVTAAGDSLSAIDSRGGARAQW